MSIMLVLALAVLCLVGLTGVFAAGTCGARRIPTIADYDTRRPIL